MRSSKAGAEVTGARDGGADICTPAPGTATFQAAAWSAAGRKPGRHRRRGRPEVPVVGALAAIAAGLRRRIEEAIRRHGSLGRHSLHSR